MNHEEYWNELSRRHCQCVRCGGCGWYEGGTAIKTVCEKCKGSGLVGLTDDELTRLRKLYVIKNNKKNREKK